MGRIITIQSHVVKGYVGNDIAKPVLFSLGHDVLDVNTLQFAQHTGYGAPVGTVYTAQELNSVFDGMIKAGDDRNIDVIITGYVGGGDQLDVIAKFVEHVKARNEACLYFCDPVIGDDHCENYVSDDVKNRIATILVPLADVLTPNKYELAIISGEPIFSIDDIVTVARGYVYEGKKVLCTSASFTEGMTGMLFMESPDFYWHVEMPLQDINTRTVRGTGDVVTAAFAGNYINLRDYIKALTHTVNTVNSIVTLTAESANQTDELALVAGREFINNPGNDLQFTEMVIPEMSPTCRP